MQAGLRVRETVSKEDEDEMVERGELEGRVLRVGDGYQIFRKTEDLGDEGSIVKVFHEEAAALACTSVETLVRGCEERGGGD